MSLKYFCTASFENRLAVVVVVAGASQGSAGKTPPILLVLLSLERFELKTLRSTCSVPPGALFLAIDLCLLKMETGNLGADLRS